MTFADELRMNVDYAKYPDKYFKMKELYDGLKPKMHVASVKGLRFIKLSCEERFQLEPEYGILLHLAKADGLSFAWKSYGLCIYW